MIAHFLNTTGFRWRWYVAGKIDALIAAYWED